MLHQGDAILKTNWTLRFYFGPASLSMNHFHHFCVFHFMLCLFSWNFCLMNFNVLGRLSGFVMFATSFDLILPFTFGCSVINDGKFINNEYSDVYLVTTLDPIPLEAFTLQVRKLIIIFSWKFLLIQCYFICI